MAIRALTVPRAPVTLPLQFVLFGIARQHEIQQSLWASETGLSEACKGFCQIDEPVLRSQSNGGGLAFVKAANGPT